MCARYTLGVSPARIAEEFELATLPELQPRFNIAPTQPAPVVVAGREGLRLEVRRWGLVPFWAEDPKIGNRLINARAESIAEKPAFRDAFRRHRCLVPADGFYEWAPAGKRRQPFHVRRADAGLFAMAGIYETWHTKQPDQISSFTILTTDANSLLQPIHDRMPVILPRSTWKQWLDVTTPPAQLHALLAPASNDGFEAYPVSMLVNGSAVDEARCREPLTDTRP